MNIQKTPQYHLYLLTLYLLMMKKQLIPENCDERCIDATIITRAYYSSYLFCELWLKVVKNFRVKHPWEFKKNEKRMGEHKQVRKALFKFNKNFIKDELETLASLRNKADYHPNKPLTKHDVNDAITHMENIFNHLKF